MKRFLNSDMALYVAVLIAALIITSGLQYLKKPVEQGKLILEAPVVERAIQANLVVQILAIEGVKDKVKMIVFFGTCTKSKEITLKELSSKKSLNKILFDLIDKEMASGECEEA